MQHEGSLFIFLLVAGVVLAGIIWSAWLAKKRREALAALAAQLGLSFDPEKNYEIAQRFEFFNQLRQGDDRYAVNTLSGNYQGHEVLAFDYHYETHSHDSKGHRTTQHHWFSFFILMLPRSFPKLTLAPEGLLSKIAQAFGYDDIDFESAEFSRKYCVRCPDKKLAYDVCNPRMIDFLLSQDSLNLEMDRQVLSLHFPHQLSPEEVPAKLNLLTGIRQRFPEYLWTQS
jgi:hypothetical protein